MGESTWLNVKGYSVSILPIHHIIPRWLSRHRALSEFNVDAAANHIYLPADSRLAANMGLSPHSGGHLGSYYKGVSGALCILVDKTDPAERANKVRDLVDSMRVALANGDLYANRPDRITSADADTKNQSFFDDWEGYAEKHKDQIAAVRALEERGVLSQQPGLVKWSAIVDDPRRVQLLEGAIANNPGVNITRGNRDLGGTPFARFSAVDPIPRLPPSIPLNPNDVRPSPGYLPQRDTFRVPVRAAPPIIPFPPGLMPSDPLPPLPGRDVPQEGIARPQTLTRLPAEIVSDRFAPASQAMLNGTFAIPREPGLESGDGVFALLPALMLAAPAVAPAVVSAAAMLARAGAGGGELAAVAARAGVPAWLARAAAGGGLFPSPAPAAATDAPAVPRTPNQIVADDFQSLKDVSAGTSVRLPDRSEPDGRPFVMRANNLENQRRVSDLTDGINGGPGRPTQQIPATAYDRAVQLAGLPDGGITLGQRTPFPPPGLSTDLSSSLPAVLRGIDLGSGLDYPGPASQMRADPRATSATDENSNDNGGPGRVVQPIPAIFNRAAQLFGLPDGGLTLGQRTPFLPPPVASTDLGGLPAVLRGLTQDQALTPTNNRGAGSQDVDPSRQPIDDDLLLLDFLRKARANMGQSAVRN